MTTKDSRSFGEYDSSPSQQILIRDSSDTWFKDLRRGVYILFIKLNDFSTTAWYDHVHQCQIVHIRIAPP